MKKSSQVWADILIVAIISTIIIFTSPSLVQNISAWDFKGGYENEHNR